jgi:uncharacterized protein (UPF0332 family)
MSHASNKVKWCLNKAEKELADQGKHRGLVKVEPDLVKAREHLEKAEHNLKTTLYLYEGGFSDWCSSTIFYTIYHCFLGILAKKGYESRNQECTFALIEGLVEEGQADFTKEEIEKISSLDVEEVRESASAVSLREEFQYSTKLRLGEDLYSSMLELAKNILYKTKLLMED